MAKRRTGKSGSKKPIRQSPPIWVKLSPTEIEKIIVKLAKEGHDSSLIGIKLRDNYAVPDVKKIINKSILQVIRDNDLAPQIPEDLYHLIKKSVVIRNHLFRNKKDKFTKKGLILTESKIRKLSKSAAKEIIKPIAKANETKTNK